MSLVITISSSLGHAQIKGNELADKLAKEAALEAKDIETETTLTTHEDILKAAHDTCLVKWQRQWEINENSSSSATVLYPTLGHRRTIGCIIQLFVRCANVVCTS